MFLSTFTLLLDTQHCSLVCRTSFLSGIDTEILQDLSINFTKWKTLWYTVCELVVRDNPVVSLLWLKILRYQKYVSKKWIYISITIFLGPSFESSYCSTSSPIHFQRISSCFFVIDIFSLLLTWSSFNFCK